MIEERQPQKNGGSNPVDVWQCTTPIKQPNLPRASTQRRMFLQRGDKILFQGDSITHAFRKPEEVGSSYRLGAGWVMLLAAQLQAEHPELNLQFENRGLCGNGIADLIARWESDCLALRPTVLNLLVGVNETCNRFRYNTGLSLADFKDGYEWLLTSTRKALPQIRLVLCEPFLLEVDQVTAAWRDDLRERQLIVRELSTKYEALFVPMQEPLDAAAKITGPAHWLFDGIHPNAAGQWLIMQNWRQQVLGK